MTPNRSPWITQLNRTRPILPLDTDLATEVAIVGGGIAGVSTAYFTLRDTDKKVALFEADMIAHGATGHNAGQITSYFERPLVELVEEFGLELAVEGQRSVESAWELLDQIIVEAGVQTPRYRFVGHAGLSSLEQLQLHLRNNQYRLQGGLPAELIRVAEEWEGRSVLGAEYAHLYTLVPQAEIDALLETESTDYIAALSYQKGCMNSALFSEELIAYLSATYPDRFSFYEGSPVSLVSLQESGASLTVGEHVVQAELVVLCTNGFEYFTIKNEAGPDIDTAFHHSIDGRIGYMSAYLEADHRDPTAISYFRKTPEHSNDPTGEDYFYLTRRPHDDAELGPCNLICTGGPEKVLPSGAGYSRKHECAEDIAEAIDAFMRDNYAPYPEEEIQHPFCWHGLMGYTPNGVRRVGPEPVNPVLLYNLGCNGVGILPSVFGAKRIAQHVKGEMVAPSIFDPHDQRTRSKQEDRQTV